MAWPDDTVDDCEAQNPGKRIVAAAVRQQRDSRKDPDDDEIGALDQHPTIERGIAEIDFVQKYGPIIDWWMLQKFPGRTLEELDQIDWFRFLQAMDVGQIVEIERKRQLMIDGKLKTDLLTARDWAIIERHDELYENGYEHK